MSPEPTFETTVTGIPLWLLREYLEELGGSAAADGLVCGDGWTARLAQTEDHVVGSLRVGRVHVALAGRADALARVRPGLEKKLLRAGG